jgi:uncharacterized protein
MGKRVFQSGRITKRHRIAVIGSGISGLAAAWLLSRRHEVTVFEKEERPGGHSNTVTVRGRDGSSIPVDTGFIVYNEPNYPNLTALFRHLDVGTAPTDMSFGVSLDNGRLEYAGTDLASLLAQPSNALRPRFWRMLRDLLRFYREAPALLDEPECGGMMLGDYLESHGYDEAFVDDHLLPMAAAIWSAPTATLRHYPIRPFLRFCVNHGLLRLDDRPQWRTVVGGSREYVAKLLSDSRAAIRYNAPVRAVRRDCAGISIHLHGGDIENFDHVVLATHADQALALLSDAAPDEISLLGTFTFQRNLAVLHSDVSLMPRRRRAWSAWNYIGSGEPAREDVTVTYWMNRLQHLPNDPALFVTLNPAHRPREGTILRSFLYDHPVFTADTEWAQREIWRLQGLRRTWYCGAWLGAGFHEDGLQAGLAVAEALGSERRPWSVEQESGRIQLGPNGSWAPQCEVVS